MNKPSTIILLFCLIPVIIIFIAYFIFNIRGYVDRKIVVSKYFCSDVCPNQGRWYTVYKDIDSAKECLEIGGKTINDPAWGGFIGCAPK